MGVVGDEVDVCAVGDHALVDGVEGPGEDDEGLEAPVVASVGLDRNERKETDTRETHYQRNKERTDLHGSRIGNRQGRETEGKKTENHSEPQRGRS